MSFRGKRSTFYGEIRGLLAEIHRFEETRDLMVVDAVWSEPLLAIADLEDRERNPAEADSASMPSSTLVSQDRDFYPSIPRF